MIENGDEQAAVSDGRPTAVSRVETILAAQLHVTDVVRESGALRTVTSLRMQGAPPEMCVEFAGLADRRHYDLTAPVSVLRRR
ncbi:hypothetical protein ABIB25_004209 [Nakamurella sp. UYEF19]|uniref:hypothetical protein n=1 Tax=Nakamurella sp. UYEF19 TaxID=1756392 RepID=UPI0033987D2D